MGGFHTPEVPAEYGQQSGWGNQSSTNCQSHDNFLPVERDGQRGLGQGVGEHRETNLRDSSD